MRSILSLAGALALLAAAGCGDDTRPPAEKAGALIRATLPSTVGVLLDEFPAGAERERVAAAILARPDEFWTSRARRQAKLTSVRLVFRRAFYDEPKDALPITPESNWEISLGGKATRRTIGGHDVVAVDYTLTAVIVSDDTSPAISEPALATVGGTWDEPFELPVDPEQMMQRMGYACISENQFPPNSVDPEELDSMYDQTCEVELTKSNKGCHLTELPSESCLEALDNHVGRVSTMVHFERLAYDRAVADLHRVGEVVVPDHPDLEGIPEQFQISRLVYRYIPEGACSIVEQCVGGAGWRRLLLFTGSDKNVGGQALRIGKIDYYDEGSVASQLIDHGVYELSACHKHYHFMHYGTFTYGGDGANAKRGFCLQSTNRFTNNEYGTLNNEFYDCSYQGVGPGWGDEYRAGLECQWVDVTAQDTRTAPVTKALEFRSNPDGFLCEGTLAMDAAGTIQFAPSDFKTLDGRPVDRPVCDFFDGWDENNHEAHDVTLPVDGEGYVTAPCAANQIGPRRNCELRKAPAASHVLACAPGAQVKVRCTVAAGSKPQTVRVCDHSAALGTGIPCTHDEALGRGVVDDAGAVSIDARCPALKSATEPGGKLSIYQGAAFNDDEVADVTCAVVP